MIVVDDREPKEVAAHLALELAGETKVEIDRLPFGDIWWPAEAGTYGFELKSTSDLLHSLWSKENGERLEWQLSNLREFVDVPTLAHHGSIVGPGNKITVIKELGSTYGKTGPGYFGKTITETGYKKSSLAGFIWGVQHPEAGRPVGYLHASTKDDLLDSIVTIYRWSQKTNHKTFNHTPNKFSKTFEPNLAALVAVGVGEKKAELLLDIYGSVMEILTAGTDILKVKGIGPDVVKKLEKLWPKT